MTEISEQDAAKLVSMIYRPELSNELTGEGNGDGKADGNCVTTPCSVGELVNTIESNMSNQSAGDSFGGEMSKSEYQHVLDQIKSSDQLMSMEIVNFENNENTAFRAMTLRDPKNKVRPVVVFRGTASDYQWDDNFAGMISSRTPSQQEAQRYVVRMGYDHLTIVGHSKGGNMAASMAYLLPIGMVDRVYSFDGQGASNLFLMRIPEERRRYAKNIVYNTNEYRDIVSQLLYKMGADRNSTYFDSGVDAKDTDYGFSFMYFFHPHKPNYFLLDGYCETGRSFVPAGAVHQISQAAALFYMLPNKGGMEIARFLGGLMHDGRGDAWSYELWNAVYDAEKMYDEVNRRRQASILAKLSEMYGFDISKYRLVQEEGSEVVESAVLACPFCSDMITLENIEDHGKILQDKPVAWKKDRVVGTNICVEGAICSVMPQEAVCMPEISHDWLITDPDKTVGGEEIVLKKSALGCLRGAMIEVVHNGQINPGDLEKRVWWKEWMDASMKMGRKVLEVGKSMGILKNPYEVARDRANLVIDLGESIVNAVTMGCGEMVGGISRQWDEMKRQAGEAVEEYVENWVEDQITKVNSH